jgi:signal peptidase I
MSADASFNLERELDARRGKDHALQHRRIEWQLRLTSLWSPLACFLVLFVPYVMVIQFSPPSESWAQPVIKALGAVMVLATVALGLARLVIPRFGALRRARVEAQDLLFQIARELRQNVKGREPMLPFAERVDARWHERDPQAIDKAADELNAQADKQMPGWRRRSHLDAGYGLLLTLLGVVALRIFVVEPFKIPSGSMLPTLEIGDQVVVNRFIYGVRIPFLNKVPFVIVRPPGRGDVIVFVNPLDPSRDYIKRVVGVPGDRVEIVNEVIHINGMPQEHRPLSNGTTWVWEQDNGKWYPVSLELREENLSGIRHAIALEPNDPRRQRTQGPWTVPEDSVFVLGDNRDHSGDSRYGFAVRDEVAFVPYGYIKGKAMLVWLSLGHGGWLSNIFGGTGIRADRFFEPVR